MARRRRDTDQAIARVASIPWWVWLAAAFVVFVIGRSLIGVQMPRSPSLPAVASVSLGRIVGYGLTTLGCLSCILLAIISARARRRIASAPSDTDRVEPTWGRQDQEGGGPSREPEAPEERDLYQEWKRAGEQAPSTSLDTSSLNLALIKALEWKRLEQLGAIYFRTLKFRVDEASFGGDGGVDLRLYSVRSSTPEILVQCKAWNSWKVGVKEIRELFGVMAKEGVSEGIFLTTSTFTNDAITFARGTNITLIDGEDLLRKLLALQIEDQVHILKAITSGDFTTPTCPSCGVKMVKRVAGNTGDAFWGCARFPGCRGKLPFRERT